MSELLAFVRIENAKNINVWRPEPTNNGFEMRATPQRVKVACGHQTAGADAEETLLEVIALFKNIIMDKVPVISTRQERGEPCDLWRESDDARYSVLGPRRLIEDARSDLGIPWREWSNLAITLTFRDEGFEAETGFQ